MKRPRFSQRGCIEPDHNPEFTQLEFYAAYFDYHNVMDLCEEMLATVAEQVTGSPVIQYQGNEVDLVPPLRP